MSTSDVPFNQDTPRMQIRVLLGSIRGHLSNLEDGITSPEHAATYIEADLDLLDKLARNQDNLNEWRNKG